MRWCLETLQEAQLSTAAGQLVRRALYATLLYRNLDGTTDTSRVWAVLNSVQDTIRATS